MPSAQLMTSVSGNLQYVKDTENMADFLVKQLTDLGVEVKKCPVGEHEIDGKTVPLPPVVIGQIGNDPKKVSSSSCGLS